MKYHLLGTFTALVAVIGITTATAKADTSTSMPNNDSDRPASSSANRNSNFTVGANRLELAIHQEINQYRRSKNLPPLAFDPIVSAQAKAHSQTMARKSAISHEGFHDRFESVSEAIPCQSAAENVASNKGYGQPDLIAVKSWIDSPGHHKNIIGRYNTTGIGVVQNAKGEYYFTQIFVRKVV